jgi:hypothetical protein
METSAHDLGNLRQNEEGVCIVANKGSLRACTPSARRLLASARVHGGSERSTAVHSRDNERDSDGEPRSTVQGAHHFRRARRNLEAKPSHPTQN